MSLRVPPSLSGGPHLNDMPAEIVDDILSSVLDLLLGDWHRSPNAFIALREALCLICHRWKDVIFGSAKYWSSVTISCYSNAHNVQHLLVQLSRAKEAPLSLRIDLVPTPHPYYYDFVRFDSPSVVVAYSSRRIVNLNQMQMRQRVLPLLAAHFHRVRVLEVDGPHADSLLRAIQHLAPFVATSLERATFRLSMPDEDDPVRPNYGVIRHWHALRDLGLQCVKPFAASHGMLYTNLTVLRLYHVWATRWDEFAAALPSMRCLEMLQLVQVECEDMGQSSPVILPSVTHLFFSFWTPASVSMLALIKLPNIVAISATSYGPPFSLLVHNCEPLVRHASSLDISGERDDIAGFDELLCALTNTIELDLRRNSPAVFMAFAKLLDQAVFTLPLLRRVLFACETSPEDAATTLNKLRHPRFALDCRLVGGCAGTGGSEPRAQVEWKMDATGRTVPGRYEDSQVTHRLRPPFGQAWAPIYVLSKMHLSAARIFAEPGRNLGPYIGRCERRSPSPSISRPPWWGRRFLVTEWAPYRGAQIAPMPLRNKPRGKRGGTSWSRIKSAVSSSSSVMKSTMPKRGNVNSLSSKSRKNVETTAALLRCRSSLPTLVLTTVNQRSNRASIRAEMEGRKVRHLQQRDECNRAHVAVREDEVGPRHPCRYRDIEEAHGCQVCKGYSQLEFATQGRKSNFPRKSPKRNIFWPKSGRYQEEFMVKLGAPKDSDYV
ncbi:hypothetical protein C8R44DRAFT_731720 [Mycena epipterygia]|nr:hypothetical protein C8R44DRAFT_731720 [Mycena epipterygia]